MFVELSSCFLYPIMVIQSCITLRDKIHKKYMNNVLNQNKRVRNIRISIVDNLCSLQQYK